MSAQKPRFKLQRPRFIHFVIALLLALLIVERGAAWFFNPKAGSRDIILYTTTWCPYCESLRTYLAAYNIPFKERDVEKSMAGAAGWLVLGPGRGVPLSVIGEEVIYGYDMDRINKALRALGHSIQRPEDTGQVGLDYLSMDTGAATAQAAGEAVCARAEEFEAFYAKFKIDPAFKIQRTRFPLRKQVLSGSQPYLTTEEVVEIARDQVLTDQEPVYLDHEILETGGYSLQIKRYGEQVEVTASPEGAEPITIHKFHKESGCWFLTEYVSYEYFGSLMILSSV